MSKNNLLRLMNMMDFQIADIKVVNNTEMVGKKCEDGSLIYWPMEREGSGFTQLFKGSIFQSVKEHEYAEDYGKRD